MTIEQGGYMIYMGSIDTEVEGPFTIQAIDYSNGSASTQWATLYIRQDDGTTGVAGSGTDKLLIRMKLSAGRAITWIFNQAITAPKLIAGISCNSNDGFNVYLR